MSLDDRAEVGARGHLHEENRSEPDVFLLIRRQRVQRPIKDKRHHNSYIQHLRWIRVPLLLLLPILLLLLLLLRRSRRGVNMSHMPV